MAPQVSELKHIFRNGFVCIRRFRASDYRLLPLVLDAPLLLKNHALPSEVRQQPWQPVGVPHELYLVVRFRSWRFSLASNSPHRPGRRTLQGQKPAVELVLAVEPTVRATQRRWTPRRRQRHKLQWPSGCGCSPSTLQQAAPCACGTPSGARSCRRACLLPAQEPAGDVSLDVASTPRSNTRLLQVLHPDKGGDVRVFQRVSELKRQLDAGEVRAW